MASAQRALTAALERQGVRFVLVGGAVAGFYFLLLLAMTSAGLAPALSGPLAYAAAVPCGYALQRRWTFRSSLPHGRSLPRYLVTQGACALVSAASGAAAGAALGHSPLAISLMTTVVVSGFSYLASRYWTFSEPAEEAAP